MTKYPKKADTPASIGQTRIQYRIPLYQRLFAWDQETVSGLMDDLVKSTLVFSSNVTILVESSPTEALLAAPV